MESNRSGGPDLTAHMIERQMLLRNALYKKLAAQAVSKGLDTRYRFVTFSRELGSLGDDVAQRLGEFLGWHVFDREIVNYVSENSHVRENLVSQLDEHARNATEDTILRLLRLPVRASFGSEEYYAALLKTLAYLTARGNAILVGRGANFALHKEEGGLHIRVTASPELRIRRLSERWNITPDLAGKRMQENDAERRAFIRRYFREDLDDIRFYDAVINTDNLSAEQAAAAIGRIMDSGVKAS